MTPKRKRESMRRIRWATFAQLLAVVAHSALAQFTRGHWVASGVGAILLIWATKRLVVALMIDKFDLRKDES